MIVVGEEERVESRERGREREREREREVESCIIFVLWSLQG